jgi:hypothetical protein
MRIPFGLLGGPRPGLGVVELVGLVRLSLLPWQDKQPKGTR